MRLEINTNSSLYYFDRDIVEKIGGIKPSSKYVELNIKVRCQLIEIVETSACYGNNSSKKFVFAPSFGNIEIKDCAQDIHEYLVESGYTEVK